MSYVNLKSGTDIRGIASPLGGSDVNLTSEAVYDISAAFVLWCSKKTGISSDTLRIAVGRDSRITGPEIADNVMRALTDSGVNVLDCGMASTPAMFMTTVDIKADAAVQITASHHPFDRNGLKFFMPSGGLDGSDISEIIELADNKMTCGGVGKGLIFKIDFMSGYAMRLRRMICQATGKSEEEKPLSGYRIVVDAGNGAGGFYATEVLEKLGADITGSQFLEPDGMFPNHIPNPENEEAMDSISKAVLKAGADLGVIFDTDVDRAGCVASDGEEINRNRLIALASYIACKGEKGQVIVTDSVTSDGLKKFIEKDLGCVHYRYRRGYKNVINKAIELNESGTECPLAIETSGHAALKENYFLDDGAYLVTKIIIELAKGNNPQSIITNLELPAEEKEVRFKITVADFKSYGLEVIKRLEEFARSREDFRVAEDNREGIRVSTPNGWFLLRLSVHDPVMPLNFESKIKGGIGKDMSEIRNFFSEFDGLDISALQ